MLGRGKCRAILSKSIQICISFWYKEASLVSIFTSTVTIKSIIISWISFVSTERHKSFFLICKFYSNSKCGKEFVTCLLLTFLQLESIKIGKIGEISARYLTNNDCHGSTLTRWAVWGEWMREAYKWVTKSSFCCSQVELDYGKIFKWLPDVLYCVVLCGMK